MTVIGAGWKKSDKNGKPYISLSIDKELLPITIDETKRLSIFPIADKTNEKAPDFRLNMFVSEEQEEPKTDVWS